MGTALQLMIRALMQDGLPKLDGSSIVGFTSIDDSDLILKPDPNSFAVIPWIADKKSARMLCDVYRGAGRGRLETDPRGICQKAEEYLKTEGFDESFWGPEVEFFVFDKIEEKEWRAHNKNRRPKV